jgi:hypothetical protein
VSKCNHDCFNCPYSDCIIPEEEITLQEIIDADRRDGKPQSKEIKKALARERMKKWYAENKDYAKAKQKEYYEKHKDERKKYYEANKEKKKQYYQKNREKIIEYQRRYRKEHPEMFKSSYRKYNEKRRKDADRNIEQIDCTQSDAGDPGLLPS